jgi:hypothetical protein
MRAARIWMRIVGSFYVTHFVALGIDLLRGIVADITMIARGDRQPVLFVWLVIHSIVIATGLLALRRSRPTTSRRSRA